jgi:hypothetical protein
MSGHDRVDIREHLHTRSAMGIVPVLSAWLPGPRWPPLFDEFSSDQLQLIESSVPTHDGVEAAVRQAFDFVADAKCETSAPGEVRITIAAPGLVANNDLLACQRFVEAVLGAPGVKATVALGLVRAVEDGGADLPFIVHQASRDGITDPEVLRAVRDDEDFYRDARKSGFANRLELAPKLPVYLPIDGRRLDIRHLLPLYDVAYLPLEAFDDQEVAFGVSGRTSWASFGRAWSYQFWHDGWASTTSAVFVNCWMRGLAFSPDVLPSARP